MTLEEQLRDCAKRGELNYLSIIPMRNGFSATYAPATHCGHGFGDHADPVEAIRLAIKDWKPPRRKSAEPKIDAVPADLDFG